MEQTVVNIGCTSAANFGFMPEQENVRPLLGGVVVVSLLLQLTIIAVNNIPVKINTRLFFIAFF
jgi:hypothetical protein